MKKYRSSLLQRCHIKTLRLLFLGLMLLASERAFGQVPGVLSLQEIQQYRTERLERETRKALEYLGRPSQRFLFDYGGWYRFSYLSFDDLNNDLTAKLKRVMRIHDIRLWAALNLDNVQTFYVRQRTALNDWDHNDNFRTGDTDLDFELDQAFYSVQIDNALRRYFEVKLPLRLQFTGGQFFSEVGTGLVYSRRGIGVELKGWSRFVNFTTFWSRTPPRENNIDFSVPGFRTEGQDRHFTGVVLSYPGFSHHEPYFFWVQQKDHSEPVPPHPIQSKFDYDSYYFGLGLRGELFIKNLNYEIEGIREIGRSYGDQVRFGGPQSPNSISAWAVSTRLTKIFDVLTRPRLDLRYALATGDKDRLNPTNTVGGSAPGTTDRNFLHFGYIETGYMLSPRLSNLQMLRIGGSIKPLDFDLDLKDNLEVGVYYYLYKKDVAKGGISDFRANRPLNSLGQEFDAYINYKVLSDVFVNFNYGKFWPSGAFGEKTVREYFLASLTFQF
ncbi:MAG TPA: alginate export family protein [Candidatus Hypogeohydataceae bacterium YC40]